jgi:hypothetical protein
MAAGAGVDRLFVPLGPDAQVKQRALDVFSSASAGIRLALNQELIQCALIKVAPLRLPQRRLVWPQPAGGQLLKDLSVCSRLASGQINVLNANEPVSIVISGIEPTGKRCHERARVHCARGGWSETAAVTHVQIELR